MRRTSNEYIEYLKNKKNISNNTISSYRSDLDKMIDYFNMYRIFDYEMINETNLNSYVLYLELKGNSNATIVRNIAVMKGYFDYLFKTHRIEECITDNINRPIIEKKIAKTIDYDEIDRLLESVKGAESPKEQRDYAMLKLFCDGGIPVSELIGLRATDVNLDVGFVQSISRGKCKIYGINNEMTEIIRTYLENGRCNIIADTENTILFTNMQGQPMSRQGVWKMVKTHAKKVGITDINPAKLCRVSEK